MELETEDLLLVPLDAGQLGLYSEDLPRLENQLAVRYDGEPVEGEMARIIREQADVTARHPTEYLFRSFWLLIRKQDRVVVGSADFKAPPDETGTVEIGYGLGSDYTGHGYMSQAVDAMCRWALARDDIQSVIAETLRENFPSQNILRRCGFVLEREAETLWWRRC